jgi:hypothetical protein
VFIRWLVLRGRIAFSLWLILFVSLDFVVALPLSPKSRSLLGHIRNMRNGEYRATATELLHSHSYQKFRFLNGAEPGVAARMANEMGIPKLGESWSEREVRIQALIYTGKRAETISGAFRVDARSPEEMLRAGGFFPNAAKRRYGDLLSHISPGTSGTGNWVSFGLPAANERAFDYLTTKIANNTLFFEGYQYELSHLFGINTLNSGGVDDELEFLATSGGIPVRYRTISDRMRGGARELGEWRTFPNSTAP